MTSIVCEIKYLFDMFYGTKIIQDTPLLSCEIFKGTENFEYYHVSAVVLEQHESQRGNVRLIAKINGEDVIIAILSSK